jgi:hypothetical protein
MPFATPEMNVYLKVLRVCEAQNLVLIYPHVGIVIGFNNSFYFFR